MPDKQYQREAVYIYNTSKVQYMHDIKGEGHIPPNTTKYDHKEHSHRNKSINIVLESKQTDQTEAEEGRWRSSKITNLHGVRS